MRSNKRWWDELSELAPYLFGMVSIICCTIVVVLAPHLDSNFVSIIWTSTLTGIFGYSQKKERPEESSRTPSSGY